MFQEKKPIQELNDTVAVSTDNSKAVETSIQERKKVVGKVTQIANNSLRGLYEVALPLSSSLKFRVGEIQKLEDLLKDYSVDDVKQLLQDIDEDREFLHYHSRDNTIHNVIINQPHSTEHFAEYYSIEKKSLRKRHYLANGMVYFVCISMSIMLSYMFSMLEGSLPYDNDPTWFILIGVVLSIISCYLATRHDVRRMRRNGSDFGHSLYGPDRHLSTLDEYRVTLLEREEANKAYELEKLKEKASRLNESLTSFGINDRVDTSRYNYTPRKFAVPQSVTSNQPTMPNMSGIKADYKEALDTVASYELDIMKAIKYPTFNDIGVKEIREMHLYLKESGQAIQADDAVTARERVNKLTIAVKVAQRKAEQVAWTGMTEKERSDLQLAQNLITQVENKGNTKQARAIFYERLRKVIDRLNSQHSIIPKKTTLVIEEKSRKELTQG